MNIIDFGVDTIIPLNKVKEETNKNHTQKTTMKTGQKITFTKTFNFGKEEEVTATIIAVKKLPARTVLLMDTGDELRVEFGMIVRVK